MITAETILKIARAEVGTKATNYKKCKYNTWFYGAEVSGSEYHWCAVFVIWCFNQAHALNLIAGKHAYRTRIPDAGLKYASCGYLAEAYMKRGQLIKPKSLAKGIDISKAKVGDLVFFHWSTEKSTLIPGTYVSDHVGVIEKVNADGTLTTIEGNTGSSANGEVLRRTRNMGVVSCLARPAYDKPISLKGKKGIDIGDHNGNVNFDYVKKAGYDFVMLKCGYGSDLANQDDAQFNANVKKAEAAGMPWGAWLYSYALNKSQAESEVKHIIRMLKGKKPTLPVALDMEDADDYKKNYGCLTREVVSTVCKTVLSGLKKAGYYPMLYTGYDMLPYLTDEVLNMADLWWAQWWTECQYKADNVGMWQYGGEVNYIDSNNIPGVGVVDKDLCYKDYPTIIKQGGYNGWNGGDHVKIPDVFYRVRVGGKWQKEVDNLTSFAGIKGKPITDIAIKVTKGRVKYQVHIKGGDWLPWVTGYNVKDDENGYAGDAKPIDAIRVYYYTPAEISDNIGLLRAKYRVSPVNGNYYGWQYDDETSGNQDGYAGDFGKTIDRLQIILSK